MVLVYKVTLYCKLNDPIQVFASTSCLSSVSSHLWQSLSSFQITKFLSLIFAVIITSGNWPQRLGIDTILQQHTIGLECWVLSRSSLLIHIIWGKVTAWWLEVWKCRSVSLPTLFFFSKIFWLFGAPCIYIWIWEQAFPLLQQTNKQKQSHWYFHRHCIEFVSQLREYCHLKKYKIFQSKNTYFVYIFGFWKLPSIIFCSF